MSRFCRDGGLKVDVHQMTGNCFALYVRFNGGWNGHRRIVHTHQGGCTSECEPCCSGYDPQGAALIMLVGEWARQAGPLIEPIAFRHRPLDEVVNEIAQGLTKHAKPKRKAKP